MTIARRGLTAVAAMAALVAMMLAMTPATAQHDHGHGHQQEQSGTPESHGGHMKATPGSMDDSWVTTGIGVVYMTITNDGDSDDTLVKASTDRAREVSIHETVMEGNIGYMERLDGPLLIPAGESVSLDEGGMHMMLVNLTDDIRLGDTFDLTLSFEHAGEVTIPVTAVLDADEAGSEPVTVGDLTIEGVWSRPAPMIDGMTGTPVATPES